MNIAVLVGNVASDPDLRHSSTGRTSCTFRLAVSRPHDEQADFFHIVTHERQATICKDYLRIGRRVSIEGRMRGRLEPVEQDDARPSVEILAHRIELLGAHPASCRTAEASPAQAERVEAVR